MLVQQQTVHIKGNFKRTKCLNNTDATAFKITMRATTTKKQVIFSMIIFLDFELDLWEWHSILPKL